MYMKELDTRNNTMETNKTVTEGCSASVEIGSRQWLLQTQIETFEKIVEMTKRKNADYAGKGGDAFNNFSRVEGLCPVISTEMGFYVRLVDKFSRIGSFIQNGELQVKDESVEDTLLDLANYSFLFYAFLKAKKLKANAKKSSDEYQVKMFQDALKYREMNRKTEASPVNASDNNHDARKFPESYVDKNLAEVDVRQVDREYSNAGMDAKAEIAFLRGQVRRYQDAAIKEEKNKANLLHSNSQMAKELAAYNKLGTPTQLQMILTKMDQVLSSVETYPDGAKNFVPRDHKSFIHGGNSEGNCDEDYSNVKNGLEHN